MAYYFETTEDSSNSLYTTHYYKTTYNKLRDSIISFAKKNNLEVIDVNDEFNEACIKTDKIILNIKFTIVSAIKIGIDFNIEADYFLFARKNVSKLLNSIYEFLVKEHTLIGVGINNVK